MADRQMTQQSESSVKARLTKGPVAMGLLGLTLPMVIGISASIVASIIEIWFLGRVGTGELAAFSFTFPVTGALTSLSFGVSSGFPPDRGREISRLTGVIRTYLP
jgi:Na+-driven multidrug efflux pump